MPRPCLCRRVSALPKALCFKPRGIPLRQLSEVVLSVDGLEAVRLADYLGLNMDEAAARMGVSRHTFGRLLRRARQCVAQALIEGRALRIAGGVCALAEETNAQGEIQMSEAILVAVPSDAPGGLEAAPSAHFGHCDAYTLALVENGAVSDVRVLPNSGHEHGNCLQPVQELAAQGVRALLAGGMGMRPLTAMQAAGITVYYNAGQATVGDALKAFAEGRLQPFGTDQLCRGGCNHHH
ncbi:DUF134 domain-containing protein [uncultured Desulfovibrio sp.]|uniref:DUF134 domain-containing protein n=2 Tax=uncultured Desulfovibrio sp. TaxID=167968 RepID=UPI00263894FF|nr:DUF134 domain-containing protein [uncultured Desulfovibrio sp.]